MTGGKNVLGGIVTGGKNVRTPSFGDVHLKMKLCQSMATAVALPFGRSWKTVGASSTVCW